MAVLILIILSPLIALFSAFVRALVLFLPVMWVLNWTHNFIPLVPALGWQASFLVIALLSLLIPVGSSTSTK